MEAKGLGSLISDPRGRPLSLSALQVLCPPARSLQMLPALPHQKPVLIPSGPRQQSLGVVKLTGEGYRLFPANAFFTF